MKKILFTLSFFLFTAVSLNPLYAIDIEYAKVFDVVGNAKFIGYKSGNWKPLAQNLRITSGTRIKTASQSSVQIKLKRDFTSVIKVSSSAYLKFKNEPPNKIYLEKGDLYVILEPDTETAPAPGEAVLQISTKDLLIEIRQGGCIVSVTEKGTWLKVFQEKAQVTHVLPDRTKTKTWTVYEGYALHAKSLQAQTSLKRMQYSDYDAWQGWIRGWYEHKDRITAEKLRKELYV